MFGKNKLKYTTDHVVTALRPVVAITQRFIGLPPFFWNDEYVLGFFGFMISFHASVTSRMNLSVEEKGQLLTDVFTQLSNLNGTSLSRKFAALAHESPEEPNFKLGGDHASIIAFASIGKGTEIGRQYIDDAKQELIEIGKNLNNSNLTELLMENLYWSEMKERFGSD